MNFQRVAWKITAISGSNPVTLTLDIAANNPSGTALGDLTWISVNDNLYIDGVSGTNCTALNGNKLVTGKPNSTQITVNVTLSGCTTPVLTTAYLGYSPSGPTGQAVVSGWSTGSVRVTVDSAVGTKYCYYTTVNVCDLTAAPYTIVQATSSDTSGYDVDPRAILTITSGLLSSTVTPLRTPYGSPNYSFGAGLSVADNASGKAVTIDNTVCKSDGTNCPIVAATSGGTGQSTLTTGDTLYASATNTISKLGIGSTGQVLTVAGGVPTWAASAGGFDPLAQTPRYEWEDFVNFTGSKLGWGNQNTNCTVSNGAESGHIGVWKLSVPATSSSNCIYGLATSVGGNLISATSTLSGTTFTMGCLVKSDDTSLTGLLMYCGIGNTGLVGADGFGVRYDVNQGDTNWMCYNSFAGGAGTTSTSTGLAVATNTWYYLKVAVTGTNQITCTVNGANPAIVNATFSSSGAAPSFRVGNATASAHNMGVDFVAFKF
jgi:hypothetical protein